MEGREDNVHEVNYQTLTEGINITSAVSKTTEFQWKLTRIPMGPNDVEIITFQTGALLDTDMKTLLVPLTSKWELRVMRNIGLAGGDLYFMLSLESSDVELKEMPAMKCELNVRQKENQIIQCFFELNKKDPGYVPDVSLDEDDEIYAIHFMEPLEEKSPLGYRNYEPLKLAKETTTLWLRFKLIQFASERVEDLQAVKRRKLNEMSVSQVVMDLGNVLQSNGGTDFKITTNCGHIFDVHRCILAARSPVLAKIIETDMLESVTGQLILKDIGAKAMDFLLKFLYSGTLKSVVGLGNEAICELINAATKYELHILKEYLDRSIPEVCTVENAEHLHDMCLLHELTEAAEGVQEYIVKNIKEVLKARIS